jgi:hypothetical protein
MKLIPLFSFTLSLLLSSCIIFPHYDHLADKIDGTVRNKHGEPVVGAKIDYIYGERHEVGHTYSKSDGSYSFGPFRQWFWITYIGSPGVAPFPYSLGAGDKPDMLRVSTGQATAIYLRGNKVDFYSRTNSSPYSLQLKEWEQTHPKRWLGNSTNLTLDQTMRDKDPTNIRRN